MSFLIKLDAVLQRLIHNLLHMGVHCRVNSDSPILSCQFNEGQAIGIVDAADLRKLKTGEWFHVRQVGSIKKDVIESGCNECCRSDRCAHERANEPSQFA